VKIACYYNKNNSFYAGVSPKYRIDNCPCPIHNERPEYIFFYKFAIRNFFADKIAIDNEKTRNGHSGDTLTNKPSPQVVLVSSEQGRHMDSYDQYAQKQLEIVEGYITLHVIRYPEIVKIYA
jgi:hypothetical protein